MIDLKTARAITDALHQPLAPWTLPVGEAVELDADSGWAQWDMATKLGDSQFSTLD